MSPLADILHRTFVVGLLGATVLGVGTGWAVHKDTLRRGQGSSVSYLHPLISRRDGLTGVLHFVLQRYVLEFQGLGYLRSKVRRIQFLDKREAEAASSQGVSNWFTLIFDIVDVF
jgi:hypothetical protein